MASGGGLWLDAYVRLPVRDAVAVTVFLDEYAPHWRKPDAWLAEDYLERVALGLQHRPLPDDANLYLVDKVWPLTEGLDWVIVSFDNVGPGVVLGLSIPDDLDAAAVEAERRLTEMQALLRTGPGF